MMKLRVISFFLALVLTIQMLPIAQIGYALSSSQWTEECPRTATEDLTKSDNYLKNFLPVTSQHILPYLLRCSDNIYIHSSEQIPSNHSTNVVTPPPDVMA